MSALQKAYLEIGIGDRTAYASALKVYEDAQDWLSQRASSYSLPSKLEDLDDVQLETLASIYVRHLLAPIQRYSDGTFSPVLCLKGSPSHSSLAVS